ncbi:MAG: TIGR03936 family radical SAM-associated protein [Phycisphaerae bacterium]|nr:TIGR03936 family radical SAM-associated protein [Phycisphaerae bacterium]
MRFSVEGDARFLSHHETLRALELAAVRAELPLKYSQGFNPHPILSLPAPRPVGVSSGQELLVLALEAPRRAEEVLVSLVAQAPRGVRFLQAEALPSKGTPLPSRADYALPLGPADAECVQRRLAELRQVPTWPVERWTSPKGRRRGAREVRVIDIKPMIADVAVEGGHLRWSAVPRGDTWARPGDVLKLLGLDERVALAEVVRTAVEYADRAPGGHGQYDDASAGASEARPDDNNPTTGHTHAKENAD